MIGLIVFPADALGNQQIFQVTQISGIVAFNSSVSGVDGPAIGFNVSSVGGTVAYDLAITFTNITAGTQLVALANFLKQLVISGSTATTYIIDSATVDTSSYPNLPIVDSCTITNSGTSNCLVTLVIDANTVGYPVGAWSNFNQAAYILLSDGNLFAVDPTQTTATNVQSIPTFCTTTAPHGSLLDANQQVVATF